MMYGTKMVSQAVDYQKTMFDNSFGMMATIQEQGDKMMNLAMEKSVFFPDSGKKMYANWTDFTKNNRDNCKEYVDNCLERVREFFSTSKPASSPPAAKAAKKTEKTAKAEKAEKTEKSEK